MGGDWTIRCTSGNEAAAAAAAAPAAGSAPAQAPNRGSGPADAPQQGEPQGWQRRLRNAEGGQGQAGGHSGGDSGGGYDDVPPPPEEPEPEPGEAGGPPSAPVSEDEMVDEARSSGPQNLDHRTGEDIALALLKEHLGARPLER